MKKHLLKFITAAAMLMLFAVCGTAFAEESADAHRVVRVAFPTQQGMSEVGTSGDLSGYNYDYLQRLSEYAGWQLQFVTFDSTDANESIMSAMQAVLDGDADILGPVLKSDAVEEMFEFPKQNYGTVWTALSVLEGSHLNDTNYITSGTLRVAVQSKAQTRINELKEYLDDISVPYELVECETSEEQFQSLVDGRADALVSITLSYFAGTRNIAQFAPRPYYFVTTKGNTEITNELDAAISDLNYARPYLQSTLQQKYFSATLSSFEFTAAQQAVIDGISTLRVLCVPGNSPYVTKSSDGTPSGMMTSVLESFLSAAEITPEYTFCEQDADITALLKTGDYDCVIGPSFESDFCAQNELISSYHIAEASMALASKPNEAVPVSEATAATIDYCADDTALSAYKDVRIYPTSEECIDALIRGDADVVYGNRTMLDYYIYEKGSALVLTTVLGKTQSVRIAFSSALGVDFIAAANTYIRDMDDTTKTAYLSEANKHSNLNAMQYFVKTQPLQAAALFASICVLIIGLFFAIFIAQKSRKHNAELAAANAAKTDFMNRMSHDIRTPLNAVLGFADLIQDEVNEPDAVQRDVGQIKSSGEFLLALINDTLDMSKIESGAVLLNSEPLVFAEFEQQINALISPLCAAKDISFTLDARDVPVCFKTDKVRFKQIFFNLISNAVKFTANGGHIRMAAVSAPCGGSRAKLTISVEDNGCGMSEEFQQHLFEAFSQEKTAQQGMQGTGLGLSIVKKLVELMHGTISVQSTLGKGSIFTVSMEVETCEAPPAQAAQTQPLTALAGRHILLCEDHPVNAELAKRLLEKAGMEVTHAVDGVKGLEEFNGHEAHYFAAVLMDVRMPNMDGVEATKRIRASGRPDAQSIPIIALTANAYSDDMQSTDAAGMTAHLSKPISPDLLYETLAQLCK